MSGKEIGIRHKLTLAERVRALERKTAEHDDRLDKIERHLKIHKDCVINT